MHSTEIGFKILKNDRIVYQFPNSAFRFGGTVFGLIVDREGKPTHVQFFHAVGQMIIPILDIVSHGKQ